VLERDDIIGAAAIKNIHRIQIEAGTDLMEIDETTLPKTIEQMTAVELAILGIQPVSKELIVNLAAAGYDGVDKPEGLALINQNTLAVINDNDFGLARGSLRAPSRIPMSSLPCFVRRLVRVSHRSVAGVSVSAFVLVLVLAWSPPAHAVQAPGQGGAASIGREVAVPRHLLDGEEYQVSLAELLRHGGGLFSANWTIQEGAGRPLTKGTGAPLADPSSRLDFPRNFNRVSGPDANSCAGCHNAPFGIAGGGGDIVANVFVLGQRFDFATFDPSDPMPTRGTTDE
jgi:hypothetical protein